MSSKLPSEAWVLATGAGDDPAFGWWSCLMPVEYAVFVGIAFEKGKSRVTRSVDGTSFDPFDAAAAGRGSNQRRDGSLC